MQESQSKGCKNVACWNGGSGAAEAGAKAMHGRANLAALGDPAKYGGGCRWNSLARRSPMPDWSAHHQTFRSQDTQLRAGC